MTRVPHRGQVALVLGIVLATHLTATALWLSIDVLGVRRMPDDFAHIAGLQQLLTSLSLGGARAALDYLTQINSHYSMLAHYPLALAALVAEPVHTSARLANGLYFALLLVSVFELGRLCHSRGAGLLAAVLVSLMPAAYGGWRGVGLDFPALCLTPAAVVALLRSGGLRRPRWAAAFGVVAGLAVLAKPQSALFLFWPALAVLVRSVADARGRRDPRALGRTLAGAGLALLCLLTLSALWWGGRVGQLASVLGSHVTGAGMHHHEGDISLAGGLRHYTWVLPYLVSGPLTLALIPALVLFWRRARRHRLEILLWLVLPLLVHVVLKVRHFRYLYPLVPAVAVVLGAGLWSLRPRRLRSAAALLAAGLGLLGWLACSLTSYTCKGLRAPVADRYQRVLDHSPDPLAWVLRCGPLAPLAPRCAADVDPVLARVGQQAGAWIQARAAAGERALLYYPLNEIYLALAVQRRLPGLRLSPFTWGDYPHYAPPAGWRRFVMLRYNGRLPDLAGVEHQRLEVRALGIDDRLHEFSLVLTRFEPRLVPRLEQPDLLRLLRPVR